MAEQVMGALPELEETTVRFVQSFCENDLPSVVKEAALFNLAHLRTQTCFAPRMVAFSVSKGVTTRLVAAMAAAPTCGITSKRPRSSLAIWPHRCAIRSFAMLPATMAS